MPSSYAVMDEEEMTYVEGGTAANFAKNLKGLWNSSAFARQALRAGGFSYAALGNMAKVSYWYVMANVAGRLGISIGRLNAVVGSIAGLCAGVLCAYVWSHRLWY